MNSSIDTAVALEFNKIVKKVKKEIKAKFPSDTLDDLEKKVGLALQKLKINNQTFDYYKFNPHLGGTRWFILCPKCKRKNLRLYIPRDKNKEQKYLCYKCHELIHTSLQLGSTAKYREVVKPLRRLEKIRRMLLKGSTSPSKAQPFIEEYERLEKTLSTSPAYKLWKFRLEHSKYSNQKNVFESKKPPEVKDNVQDPNP